MGVGVCKLLTVCVCKRFCLSVRRYSVPHSLSMVCVA